MKQPETISKVNSFWFYQIHFAVSYKTFLFNYLDKCWNKKEDSSEKVYLTPCIDWIKHLSVNECRPSQTNQEYIKCLDHILQSLLPYITSCSFVVYYIYVNLCEPSQMKDI